MVKSVRGYTIFYQTDNNLLMSMEQRHEWSSGSKCVPQGSMLGPLLFLIHISDINDEITYSTVSCFLGDTRILLVIKVMRTPRCYKMTNINCSYGRYKQYKVQYQHVRTSTIRKRTGNKYVKNLSIVWWFEYWQQRKKSEI